MYVSLVIRYELHAHHSHELQFCRAWIGSTQVRHESVDRGKVTFCSPHTRIQYALIYIPVSLLLHTFHHAKPMKITGAILCSQMNGSQPHTSH